MFENETGRYDYRNYGSLSALIGPLTTVGGLVSIAEGLFSKRVESIVAGGIFFLGGIGMVGLDKLNMYFQAKTNYMNDMYNLTKKSIEDRE